MKHFAITCAGLLFSGITVADNLEGSDEFLCAAGLAQVCFENGECISSTPWELSIPDFVVVDVKGETVSTTKASGENRSSPFSSVERIDGVIYLQGFEGQRLFSFVIDENSGRMTVAIARDGLSITVFGVCTDSDI